LNIYLFMSKDEHAQFSMTSIFIIVHVKLFTSLLDNFFGAATQLSKFFVHVVTTVKIFHSDYP